MNESLAKAGAAAPWAAWFLAYLPIMTGVAQLLLFLVGIVSGIATWRYYRRKRQLLGRPGA